MRKKDHAVTSFRSSDRITILRK